MRVLPLLLSMAALCAPWTGVGGQADATGGVRLRSGQTVRVRLTDGQWFQGRLAGVDSTTLALRFERPGQTVLLATIDAMWLRRRAAWQGAVVGGVALGAASTALGVIVCRALSEDGCEKWGIVVLFGAAGAGGGALLGAGVGSLIPIWKRIDPERVTVSLGVDGVGFRAATRVSF